MSVFTDRTRESSTTTGTGTITTSASAPAGFQTFATAGLDGQTVEYCIEAVDADGVPTGDWEVGRGVYTTAGSTLTRATVLASSNAGAAVNFAAGTKNVFVTVPAYSVDVHRMTSKATPVDADEMAIWDSAAGFLKKLTWANLKATLKSYFDTLYAPTILFACNSSATSLANVNTVQSIFPSGFDALTVEADSTYFFEGSIRVTNGVVAHSDAFGFGGTATFTSIAYFAEGGKHAAGSINAVNQLWIATAAMTTITAGGTTTGAALRVRGVMRVNAGGTIIPQWQFNNAPGSTNQVEANSYIRLQKVGSGSVTSSGAWS